MTSQLIPAVEREGGREGEGGREREKVKVTEINQDKEYHKQEGSYSNSWTCKCIYLPQRRSS